MTDKNTPFIKEDKKNLKKFMKRNKEKTMNLMLEL